MFKLNSLFYLTIISLMSTTAFASSHSTESDLIIGKDYKHDISLPLRDLQSKYDVIKHKYQSPLENIILNKTQNLSEFVTAPLIRLTTFQGIGVGLGSYQVTALQPNVNGSAGLTQYVQFAAPDMAVFSKTGQLLPGFPKAASSLWAGFGGTCENFAHGRLTMKYDQIAKRWVFSQFADEDAVRGPFFHCIAVSTSDDATGTYHRYAFQLDSLSDYARLSVWPDGFYLGLNMVGRLSFGPRMCVVDRSKMLNGEPASIICKQLLNSESGPLMPTNILGQALFPPVGTPEYFLALDGTNLINVFKFSTDFVNPQNTKITKTTVPVHPFKQACQNTNGEKCAIQPDTDNKLNLYSDRFMTRVVFREFPGGYGSIVAAHVIEGPQPKFAPAIRWYELRVYDATASRNPIVYQQSTLAPDSKNRFTPSINIDRLGNIAIGYTVSSSKVYPSPEMAWRSVSDPLNTMTIQPLVTSRGAQVDNISDWTMTSKLVTDPVNLCTMYHTGEYLKTTGSLNWSTAIVKFDMPGCS